MILGQSWGSSACQGFALSIGWQRTAEKKKKKKIIFLAQVLCVGRVSLFSGRTGRTFNFPPRFPLEAALPRASPGRGAGEGPVLGAAPAVPGELPPARRGGFQRCRQRHWSCLRRQTSLVTGICYSGRARGRGDRLQGAFVSPAGLSPPALLSGFCIQRRMPGGLLLDPLEPKRMDFNYPILFVH